MSEITQYHVPEDAVLCELGRLQVIHSHLDHSLRLGIKRSLEISIDDPGYWTETKGMSAQLREKLRELIDGKYRDDDDKAGILNKALDDAQDVTLHRNRALHSVWINKNDDSTWLNDRDNFLKAHRDYRPPTTSELKELADRAQRVQRVLNHLIPP